jgi:hypothetical protein
MKTSIKRFFTIFQVAFLLTCGLLPQVTAGAQQNPELELRLSRNFGYSSGFSSKTYDIQGNFTLKASGPDSLSRVVFLIDGKEMGEATQAPFQLRFETDLYGLGKHTLQAIASTTDGRQLRSNQIEVNFVTAQEGMQAGMRIAGPLLGLVFGVMLLSFLASFLIMRNQPTPAPGAPRKYGFFGGTICPNCQRPFTLHWYCLNLWVRVRFDHCPYCGKWAVMHVKSLTDLRAAEAAELEQMQPSGQTPAADEEEQLHKDLENSRYQNL